MIHKLIPLLKKPKLWQRGNESFWDDIHISKGMLEAHLNPDRDAASRRHDVIDRSVKWLSAIIPEGATILDLGCGPGLYTKRLSDIGYNVTGMDLSKRSIEYAKSQDTKTEYICKNYLELDYTSVFDAVTLIYCDYAALTKSERQVLLAKVYDALKKDGLFIFDVFSEAHFRNKTESTSWSVYGQGGFWSAEPYICLEATYLYENNTVAADRHIIVTDKKIHEYLIWDTAYTKQTLTDEVSPFGFHVKGVFDDVNGSPYTGNAETLCFVLQRGAE